MSGEWSTKEKNKTKQGSVSMTEQQTMKTSASVLLPYKCNFFLSSPSSRFHKLDPGGSLLMKQKLSVLIMCKYLASYHFTN